MNSICRRRVDRFVIGDAPQLDIVIGGDRHVHDGLDLGDAALKLGVVGGKADGTGARAASHGLIRGGPDCSRLADRGCRGNCPNASRVASERHRVTSKSFHRL